MEEDRFNNIEALRKEFEAFLTKVELHFGGDSEDKIESFLQVLKRVVRGIDKDKKAACDRIKKIFGGHDDVVKDFQRLFPEEVSDEEFGTCTPSYRFLPQKGPRSRANSVDLASEVLNRTCVLVPSKDNSKSIKKSDLEKTKDRLEDDRFEMDVLLGRLESAAKKADELSKKLKNSELDIKKSVQEFLSPLNLSCIKQLYQKDSSRMIELLNEDPITVLPVISYRMKQKQNEGANFRDINMRIRV